MSGDGGRGKRGSGKVQIATGSLCKGAKVKREGGQWKRGRGDKRYSANVQRWKGGGRVSGQVDKLLGRRVGTSLR